MHPWLVYMCAGLFEFRSGITCHSCSLPEISLVVAHFASLCFFAAVAPMRPVEAFSPSKKGIIADTSSATPRPLPAMKQDKEIRVALSISGIATGWVHAGHGGIRKSA